MSTEPLHLSLIENSHAFLLEAVTKAVAATSDTRQWQFAVLNLVQALELSLKAALHGIHPALIYENIDNPKNTIGPIQALLRLANPKIGNLTFTNEDKVKIQHAVDIRNRMTHSEFQLTPAYAGAKFFELFAFVSDFQRRHLKVSVSEIVPTAEYTKLFQIQKLREELIARAEARILEENVASEAVWECPDCGADTFVIEDATDTCYTCSYSERVIECPQCSELNFESSLESFFGELDSSYDEGQTVLHNAYGYSSYTACVECLPRIKGDIRRRREEEDYHRREEEYYLELAHLRGDPP